MTSSGSSTHPANKEQFGGEISYRPLAFIAILVLAFWWTPHPEAISDKGWHLFILFIATIAGIIFRPMPVASIVLVGLVSGLITQSITTTQVFYAFSKDTIWLIVISFFLARGFVKTGLAARISYYFVKLLGKSTLGLSYGIGISELLLAPLIPSLVARSGGIIYPILLATTQNLKRDNPGKKVGNTAGFLMISAFQISCVTSAMFMTAMAANPIIVELAGEEGIELTWGMWALAASVPGLASLVLIPPILHFFMNVEIKKTENAVELAKEKLQEIGPFNLPEKVMIGTFIAVLSIWMFGPAFGINSVTGAMFGLAILILSGVLTWKDCIQEETAWSTLFWLGGLISMGTALKAAGVFDWMSGIIVHQVSRMEWEWGLLVLALFYFYSHYLFASNTAHVTSMFSSFLGAGAAIGAPPMLLTLILAYFSSLFGGLTHYSSGPAPIFYASHYVSVQKWWSLGLLISVLNIAIWLTAGLFWWKVLGLW